MFVLCVASKNSKTVIYGCFCVLFTAIATAMSCTNENKRKTIITMLCERIKVKKYKLYFGLVGLQQELTLTHWLTET